MIKSTITYLLITLMWILAGCASVPLSVNRLDVTKYESADQPIIDTYKNIDFKSAYDDEYLYLSIIFKGDSVGNQYRNSILNLWINDEALHLKSKGIQFPFLNVPHPFVRSQFNTLLGWGGFKSALSDSQQNRISSYIKKYEDDIFYFDPLTSGIRFIKSNGENGLKISRRFKDGKLKINFKIPINANGLDIVGISHLSGKRTISIGTEILHAANIRRASHSQQSMRNNAPGMGNLGRQPGMQSQQRSYNVPSSEIYWIDLQLTGDGI